MQALVATALNHEPTLAEIDRPVVGEGQSVLEVAAAPLNPIDIWVASGSFFAGHPPLPYVPGVEAVGFVVESGTFAKGTLVFTCLDGLGVSRNGTLAELALARDSTLIVVPDGVDPATAAGLGTAGLAAWIPMHDRTRVTPEDVVLVLGATGTSGYVAVQVAKSLGAKRVVAAGRRRAGLDRAEAAGADAVVLIDDRNDLATSFRTACGEPGPSVVFDPLWGKPLAAALEAAAPGARILSMGQSAGAEAVIASRVVRGKSLSILGYTTLNVRPADVAHRVLRDAHRRAAGIPTNRCRASPAP